MRAMIVLMVALVATGCSGTGVKPRVMASNPAMVVLDDADDPALSLAAADQHCRTVGRHAQYRGRMPGFIGIRAAYDCVP